jgi:hypothetical protein
LIKTSDRQSAQTADMMSNAGLKPSVFSSNEFVATVVLGVR